MTPEQFPVFLRYENDHYGPLTGLLHNQDELNRAIVRARIRQHDLRKLIIVEYVDTRIGDERYMKYGAFKVGNAIVGRHAQTGNDWVLKVAGGLNNPQSVATSFAYVRDNPHVDQLRERFDVGGVGYGRIDYAMLGESIVTWKINTNPTIMASESEQHPLSVPRQELFVSQFRAAFDALQPKPRGPSPISLRDVSQELRVASQRSRAPRTPTVLRIVRKHKHWLNPGIRAVETAAIPFQRQILERWRRSNAS